MNFPLFVLICVTAKKAQQEWTSKEKVSGKFCNFSSFSLFFFFIAIYGGENFHRRAFFREEATTTTTICVAVTFNLALWRFLTKNNSSFLINMYTIVIVVVISLIKGCFQQNQSTGNIKKCFSAPLVVVTVYFMISTIKGLRMIMGLCQRLIYHIFV